MSVSEVQGLLSPSVKLMTLAPELSKADQVMKVLHDNSVVISVGHSNASFEEAQRSFASGVKMMTHTFNALPSIHHRSPGAVAAALLDEDVYCCVICDGLHVDPNIVRLLIKTKGIDRVVLVSDIAQIGTKGGGLTGSSIYLSEAVRNVVKWQAASFADAIRMASYNPARVMNLTAKIGCISKETRADLVVWEKTTLAIKAVFANGRLCTP